MGVRSLVTGANGGLGQEFVDQALARGAAKIYAAARAPRAWPQPQVQPLALDITDPGAVAAAASAAGDVDLVVNNAAIALGGDSILGPEEDLRAIFETNFFGNLRVATAFALVLGANGGGTLLNILSTAACGQRAHGVCRVQGGDVVGDERPAGPVAGPGHAGDRAAGGHGGHGDVRPLRTCRRSARPAWCRRRTTAYPRALSRSWPTT